MTLLNQAPVVEYSTATYMAGKPRPSDESGWLKPEDIPTVPQFFECTIQVHRVDGQIEVYPNV
jgi:hypothetical protein